MDSLPSLPPSAAAAPQELGVMDDCWNRIGVQGDGTCPELVKHIHCQNCPTYSRASSRLFQRPAPPDYLAEWTQRLAREAAPPVGELVTVVVLRLGAEWFGWDARLTVEVTEPKVVRRIPHRTNRLLRGLVNIRGELQMCVSLRDLLALPEAESDAGDKRLERFLVTSGEGGRWTFPVDEVSGVRQLASTERRNVPTTVAHSTTPYTRGVYELDGRSVGHLDASRIFAALEERLR